MHWRVRARLEGALNRCEAPPQPSGPLVAKRPWRGCSPFLPTRERSHRADWVRDGYKRAVVHDYSGLRIIARRRDKSRNRLALPISRSAPTFHGGGVVILPIPHPSSDSGSPTNWSNHDIHIYYCNRMTTLNHSDRPNSVTGERRIRDVDTTCDHGRPRVRVTGRIPADVRILRQGHGSRPGNVRGRPICEFDNLIFRYARLRDGDIAEKESSHYADHSQHLGVRPNPSIHADLPPCKAQATVIEDDADERHVGRTLMPWPPHP